MPEIENFLQVNLHSQNSSQNSKDNLKGIVKTKFSKINNWHQELNYMQLFDLEYCYRMKTEAIFEQKKQYIFDFIIADDQKFEQFYLFHNFWRETMLLNHLNDDPRVAKVISFGQLPNKIIYREIEEVSGISLQEYIDHHIRNK